MKTTIEQVKEDMDIPKRVEESLKGKTHAEIVDNISQLVSEFLVRVIIEEFKDGKIIVHRYNGNRYTLLKPSDDTVFEAKENDNGS